MDNIKSEINSLIARIKELDQENDILAQENSDHDRVVEILRKKISALPETVGEYSPTYDIVFNDGKEQDRMFLVTELNENEEKMESNSRRIDNNLAVLSDLRIRFDSLLDYYNKLDSYRRMQTKPNVANVEYPPLPKHVISPKLTLSRSLSRSSSRSPSASSPALSRSSTSHESSEILSHYINGADLFEKKKERTPRYRELLKALRLSTR